MTVVPTQNPVGPQR